MDPESLQNEVFTKAESGGRIGPRRMLSTCIKSFLISSEGFASFDEVILASKLARTSSSEAFNSTSMADLTYKHLGSKDFK